MDVVSGEFKFDIHSGKVSGQLAGRAPLDPSIFGEGTKVEVDTNVPWTPPPAKPVMPDWSGIKSIRKYFGRTEFPVWPAWFYHPTHEPVLCNEKMAASLGIAYREATFEEVGRYGAKFVWDYADGCQWRARAYPENMPGRFDHANPGHGKIYVPPDKIITQQSALIAELVPTVAAAVAAALKSEGPGKPAHIDPTQWEEFLAFQAWKKTAEEIDKADTLDRPNGALTGKPLDPERIEWEEAARRIGLKADGRWSLDRLKAEVEKKASENEAAKVAEGDKAA